MSAISGKCSGERKHLETSWGGVGGEAAGAGEWRKVFTERAYRSFLQTHPHRKLLKSSIEKRAKLSQDNCRMPAEVA